MDVCKLCLLADTLEEEKEILNAKDLQHTQTLIPQLNAFYLTDSIICSVCTKDIKVIAKFMHNIKQTEQRIESTLIKENSDKLDIKSLHQKVNALPSNLKEHVGVCRLCLSFIARPHIFLYDSKTNVLHHELLKSIFQSCNINLNLSVSKNPTLCTECWEYLQITFRFKKTFLDVEKKVLFYCTKHNLRREDVDNQLLGRIYSYFSKYSYKDLSQLKNKAKWKNTDCSNHIVEEHNYVNTYTNKLSVDRKHNAPIKYMFTDEEDRVLIAAYLFVTKNEQSLCQGYWNQVFAIWNEFYLEKNFPKYAISNRIKTLRKNEDYEDLFERTKLEITKFTRPLGNSYDEQVTSPSNDISNRLGSNEIPILTSSKLTITNQRSSPENNVNVIQTKVASAKPNLKAQLSIELEQMLPSVIRAKMSLLNSQSIKGDSEMREKSCALERDIRQPKPQIGKKLKNNVNNLGNNKIVIHAVESLKTNNTNKFSIPMSNSVIIRKMKSPEMESLFKSNFHNAHTVGHSSKQNAPMETYFLTAAQSVEKTNMNNTHSKQAVKTEIIEIESNILLPNNNTSNENEKLFHLGHNSNFIAESSKNNLDDSDDSFIDGGSSFIHDIKVEPLDNSDIEISVEEPKIEMDCYLSDSDKSLPELERMDILPKNIEIENMFSFEEKRNILNSVIEQYPNINVEEVNTCRRYVSRNQTKSKGRFKCLECNFESKYRRGAAKHSEWHKKNSKKTLHECPECPYKISNKWLLKKHMKLHEEENEIPTLLPWT